ncbi:MAG: PQQ-binding-like beta-propeller repeat protein [Paludisphaera borealis]|uniref:outer membrane protein assembly factor BamB family protein n=1 Tax=Paludisphaera borealis TaxID=1387353 RepID=UPI002844B804|nr:PQQ-binding-like beta-propeller repeat protein [Paludisphaera borealis]MDR3617737.1 PQQ-binding-like beta-propeller repeat protein [Paludisphaera borealis]
MISMRSAIALLLLAPALALGQAPKDEEDKVSNDNPARPLQMPPATTEVKEALDDFERFQRRSAWERALKALYTITEDQALRFVDGDSGFIIPVAQKRRQVLTALPPEGQAAYRLFYDAEAQKLFADAEGPTELANLERIYSAYFTTTIGDDAADRLGDIYFEMGRFDRAADCWLSILHDRPDTNLSPATIALKSALALARAGRRTEFDQIRADLADRYKGDKVTIGGTTAAPAELLRRLLEADPPPAALAETAGPTPAAAEASLDLGRPIEPDWQLRIAESIEAGMTPAELNQWRSNSLSDAKPAVAVEGSTLFANYLGYIVAVDLDSGKLLWRTEAFHHLENLAMQQGGQMATPGRFAILASREYVWTVARDLKDQNYMAPFHLACRRADNGELVWKSTDLPEYALFDLTGPPLLSDGTMFIPAKAQPNPQQSQPLPEQMVLAIQPHDGKLLWKREIGVFRQGQPRFYYYNMRDNSPQVRLFLRAGSLYVDTHVGVLARLDAGTGALDWGYGYKTDAPQAEMYFNMYNRVQESQAVSGRPLESGDAILVKGAQSSRLYAIDPNRMKALWERPVSKDARLLGVDDRSLYLGGQELGSLDLKTRGLSWATKLPGGSLDGAVLVRSDGLFQLTPRGIFELDPRSGDVRRIFRGQDLGSAGGDLVLTDDRLLAVSNRTITAYPRRTAGADASARGESATPKEKTSR